MWILVMIYTCMQWKEWGLEDKSRDLGEDTSGFLGGQVRDWGDRIFALSHWMLSSHVCYNPCHFLTLDRFVITADLCYVSKKHINGKIPPNLNNMITLVLSLYSDCTKISVSFESCLEEECKPLRESGISCCQVWPFIGCQEAGFLRINETLHMVSTN